jgi:two-component system sensor kinase FixL
MPISKTAREDPLFDALISTAVDGIIVLDEDAVVRVYNRACEDLFGYTADEVIGHNVSMLMPTRYRDTYEGHLHHYLRTGERHILGVGREVLGQRKDGSTFSLCFSVGEGKLLGQRIFVGILTDLSERQERDHRIQELQAEMWRIGRLTDMGQMAAGLAHELNQPLTAILNYTNAARDIAQECQHKELEGIFSKVIEQTSRAGAIIRRLRSFIERREPHRVPEDLRRTIQDSIQLGMLDEDNIRLTLCIDPNLPKALIDRIQIQQVLVNLMINAREAMADAPRQEITLGASAIAPDMLQVSVSDTGPGIDHEIASRLFQAFVTTKKDGMGMGLNICRSIIEAHGGRLWAEPNPEGGAMFRFTLPVVKDGTP